jgi:Rad3-related DNA helicase
MLYHIPTIRLNFRTTDMELRQWVARIDQIIRPRQDRKGIVHTISYKRRDVVMVRSKMRDILVSHKRLDTESVVRKFKAAYPPMVLVSPSMATGWDFPDEECRYQIIGKIPYPDTRGKIMKARTKTDKEYTSYVAMQQLVQACGRGVRSESDWCETFVIDDNVKWFLPNYRHMAPEWFREAYTSVRVVPKAIGMG